MAPLAIIAAAGAVMGAVGSLQQGRAARAAGEYNHNLLKMQARMIRDKAKQDEQQLIIGARKQVGSMKAAYAASGVTMEGSPMDVFEESLRMANMDALTIRHQGEMNARMREYEAKMARFGGNQAQNASYFSAASQLGSAAMSYNQLSSLNAIKSNTSNVPANAPRTTYNYTPGQSQYSNYV